MATFPQEINVFIPLNDKGELDIEFACHQETAARKLAQGKTVFRVRMTPIEELPPEDDFVRILMGRT